MKRQKTILLVITFLLASTAVGLAKMQNTTIAAPSLFVIDATHSGLLFRVQHAGAGQFWGRFNKIEGSFSFAEGSDSDLSLEIKVPIESIDTNSGSRDKHLKGPDFFNAKEYPEMTFKSTSATKVSEKMYSVTGNLTLHGVTKEITAEVEWTGSNDAGARSGYRCGLEAIFTIKRSEFDVAYGVKEGSLSDDVRIIVAMEGKRQE